MKRTLFGMAFCILLVGFAWAGTAPELRLAKVFGDHMVFQQGVNLQVWGKAPAGSIVTVSLAGEKAEAKTGKGGDWTVFLEPLSAGGPFDLSVSAGKENRILKDVMVGEVWFASGQSNMEWVLNSSENPERELKRADIPRLRFFTQKQAVAGKPMDEADGEWAVSNSETAKHFSAVGYYFGKKLQAELKVPVGVVCAAWGGSACENWVTERTMNAHPDLKPIMDQWNQKPAADRKGWVDGAERRLEFTDMKLIPKDSGIETRTIGLGEWNAWAQPGSTAAFQWSGKARDGGKIGIYSGRFKGAAWGGAGTELNGGKAEDLSSYEAIEVKVRGRGVFKLELTQPSIVDYDYPCSEPVTLTQAFRTIRVKIADFKQAGWGAPKPFTPNELEKVQFQVVMGSVPIIPQAMFNGMVAPWVRFPVKGALWYQGETNAWRAEQYAPLLKALIGDWRSAWKNQDLTFLVVQLPNYDPGLKGEEKGTWPELRESQCAALDLPGTAVVTTIDVGDPGNIHPLKKEPVGKRLVASALPTAYEMEGALCPFFDAATNDGKQVRLSFKNAPGGLRAPRGGDLKGFEASAEDGKYVPARAKLLKTSVVVSCPSLEKIAHVRYAWSDNPQAELFNRAGFPLSPFRTDRFPGLTAGRR